MCDLAELVHLRECIYRRLRAWAPDTRMEQQLLTQFGSPTALTHRVTERVCYLMAVLAMDSVPGMLLDEDPGRWKDIEDTLEVVAGVFGDEIIRLRVLILEACCEGQGEAGVQTLTK
jgi:hypothetical protein